MSMEHCMINGKRCSKCCEIILLNRHSFPYSWLEYARRYMKKDNYDREECEKLLGGVEPVDLLLMLKPIKKRIAKKRNPHMFKENPLWIKHSKFFECEHLTENGCGNYENRPPMCSRYPYYGKTKEEWAEHIAETGDSGYTADCTFFVEVQDYKPNTEN